MKERTFICSLSFLFLSLHAFIDTGCEKVSNTTLHKVTQSDSTQPTDVAKRTAPSSAKAPDYAALGEKFIDLLVQEKYPEAFSWFDKKMATALPVDKLELVWKSIGDRFGAFQKRIKTQTTKRDDYFIALVFCQFKTKVVISKVVFSGKKVAGLFFFPNKGDNAQLYQAPSYADLNSFSEIEVTVGKGKWKLPGTISMPKGPGPFSAVVLVHGSGPHDRDESIGPNKPFRDLAWGLASKGIAVLRYEKRTKAHADAMHGIRETITTKGETIVDAGLAVELLRGTKKVNPKQVFVLGHSLGGTLVPRISNISPNAAGFIIMAGSTRPLEDLIMEQTKYVLELDGSLSTEDKETLKAVKEKVSRVKDKNLSIKTPAEKLPFSVPAAYWLDLRGYDPAKAAESINRPMLVMQGGRDYQVTLKDFLGWKKHLSKRSDVTFKLYPDLNHLFMEGKGKSKPAEYQVPGHIFKKVIEDISKWIKSKNSH